MTGVKRYRVSNGLLIIRKPEDFETFNLENLDVVLAADYDGQQKVADAHITMLNARIAALEAELKRYKSKFGDE